MYTLLCKQVHLATKACVHHYPALHVCLLVCMYALVFTFEYLMLPHIFYGILFYYFMFVFIPLFIPCFAYYCDYFYRCAIFSAKNKQASIRKNKQTQTNKN